uniref:Uncharacterized protein n=1 Tax=viral metagenome TaxID=1070528 RepID=A0A6H1ZXN0_9ZZZZ
MRNKPIRTDNLLTQVVVESFELLEKLKGEIKTVYRVPFMQEKKTARERREERDAEYW